MSTNRILDLSNSPARLSTRNRQLVVELDNLAPTTIPMVDLAAIVIAHPQVRITSCALVELASTNTTVVMCNRANHPIGMYLPLAANGQQVPRFRAQATASVPMRKRLWRQLIRAKIQAQAAALISLRGKDHGLGALVPLVRSGDPANVEARAARKYWGVVFGEKFRRDHDAEDANRFLNYGYAVLRAIVARAICAAGLHPTLGIHHHHRENGFCLADDLLEPFRPLVDRVVVEIVDRRGVTAPLDPSLKQDILSSLTRRVLLNGEQRTVFEAAERAAVSLVDVYLGKGGKLELPESLEPIVF